MNQKFERQIDLKEKIRSGKPTIGLFIKIPSPQVVELMAAAQFDFLVLDAEHGPFGIERLDQCLLAAQAVDIPVLVRVPAASSSLTLSVLDLGAAGVIIPHIRSEKEAHDAVAATRYRLGTRGFAASHRAAGFGTISADDYRDASDRATIVIGQVEDAQAVENIDEIASVSGLDALFIGSADLSISYNTESFTDPRIDQAVEKICTAGREANQTLGIFLPSPEHCPKFRAQGISLFFISSDQALLTKAACDLSAAFRAQIAED